MSKFVFTCGDVNGIGPEIVIKSLNNLFKSTSHKFIFITPQNVFENIIKIIKPEFPFNVVNAFTDNIHDRMIVLKIPDIKLQYGKATSDSGKTAYESIKKAYELLNNKFADAMITAPLSKEALSLGGINYPGHTEMLADWCDVKNYVMMFLSDKMNSALVTIHKSIKEIPSEFNKEKLLSTFEVVISSLQNDMSLENPEVAVLGLNPHAGENGIIGKEEEDIIIPAIRESKFSQYLNGPFSPDAFFARHLYKEYDLVLGMYHDQILIPFKMMNAGKGVNFTAGLPIVRTSPDHGVAFDKADKYIADGSSMLQAFAYAEKIVNNRK